MNDAPEISVVMSVYNGGRNIRETVDAILEQTFSNFEFIIVDDGSTDDTARKLQELKSRDARIIILTQENAGLTAALRRGCKAARGEFIARQDVGDLSFPKRFESQIQSLKRNPQIVAVGAGCRRVGPKGEFLGINCRDESPEEVTRGLIEKQVSLPHMATTFRADAYHRVGGYRMAFRFAQDIDLWYRMTTVGQLATTNEILFQMSVDATGISASQRICQAKLARFARQSFLARKRGDSDEAILHQAYELSWNPTTPSQHVSQAVTTARSMYFIGSQLLDLGDSRCREYLIQAAKVPRLLPKALLKFVQSYSRCRTKVQTD